MSHDTYRRTTWFAVLGCLLFVTLAELSARMVGPRLPEPLSWPSLESQIKAGQIVARAGEPHALLLLGDSTMEAGVDPAALEAGGLLGPVYNAALPFSSPLSMEVWATGFVLPRLRPEVVVVGMGAFSPQTTRETDQLRVGLLDAIASSESKSGMEEAFNRWFALYRYRKAFREWGLASGLYVDPSETLITERGFQTGYHRGVIEATNWWGTDPVGAGHPEMSIDNEDALAGLLMAIGGFDARAVILFEPVQCPIEHHSCLAELDDSLYRRQVREIAEERGVPVLDANIESWNTHEFVDTLHLNPIGSERLERWLIQQLNQLH